MAVNASFFGDSRIASWGSKQSTPVIIHEGNILRDDSNIDFGNGKAIYSSFGITKDGKFNFYNMSLKERVKSRNKMISDEVQYSGAASNRISKNSDDTESFSRTIVCNINNNNYILISAYNLSFKKAANLGFNILGCKNMTNLDGGGSLSLLYKDNNNEIKKTNYCTSRLLADMLYFVE